MAKNRAGGGVEQVNKLYGALKTLIVPLTAAVKGDPKSASI